MSNARPNNLPTRPQTTEIQRDRAKKDKVRFVVKFTKNRIEFERTKTLY